VARTSALGYIRAQRQTALNAPAAMTAPTDTRFFRFLSAPKSSAEMTNTRYRESGGGRDISLSIKEGIRYNMDFPMFARPCPSGYVMQAGFGPGVGPGTLGGGKMSNGLYEPPKMPDTPGNSTLTSVYKSGLTLTVASVTNFATTDKIAIGWGPTLEFAVIDGAPDVPTLTITLAAALKFPHTVGEPVHEVVAFTTLSADEAALQTTLSITSAVGLTDNDYLAIGPNATAGALGSEYGQVEIVHVNQASPSTSLVIDAPGLVHAHSAGSWVYVVRADVDAAATSKIHGNEPVTALDASLDYYTLERTVPGAVTLVERVQDMKLGTMELSAESPGPLRWQLGWKGRYAKVPGVTAAVETYPHQDPVLDLPFRMSDGKYFIEFGSSTDLSTRLRQFTLSFSNMTADDIFTDKITRDDILDLAREANFSAQFYWDSCAEYKEWVYGTATPGATAEPSTSATFGRVCLNFSIGAGKRMMIYIPEMAWENFPVDVDPEPKPIVVEVTGVPLKPSGTPVWTVGVDNKDLTVY